MRAAPHSVPPPTAAGHTHAPSHAAQLQAAAASELLTSRVGRFLQDLAAARTVSDEEVLQHEHDCKALMEAAYGRYIATGDVHEREAAYVWMNRRDEAHKALSAHWKAAREAEIQRRIAVFGGLG